MSELEREQLKNRTKNFTVEELQLIAKLIPNTILLEEISRRLIKSTDDLKGIREILRVKEGE